MNKFKKFLTVSVAGVMALSATAFAACVPGNNDDNGDDSASVGNLPAVGIDPSQPNAALLNGVLNQEYNAAGYTMNIDTASNYKYYELNDDYTKGNLISGKTDTSTYKMTQGMKMNLEDGDADIEIKEVTSSTKYKDDDISYYYSFLRDWHSFSAENYDRETYEHYQISDFSKVTLEYGGSATENMPIDMDALGGIKAYENLALGMENFTILALGNYFGGLTVDGNTATVDMNKVAYNLATQVNALLDTVDENTTIGEFLANETVKKVLSSVLSSMPAEKVLEIVSTALAAVPAIGPMLGAMGIDLSQILVKPDKDMSSYDYLVKVISSNELKNAIGGIIGSIPGSPIKSLPSTLDKMTIDFFLDLADIEINDIKALVKNYTENITADTLEINTTKTSYIQGETPDYEEGKDKPEKPIEIKITFPVNIKVSNAKVIFTLDNNKITKQDVIAKVVTDNNGMDYEYDKETGRDNYYYVNSVDTSEFTMSLEYPATEYTLKDISGCKTVEYRKEYNSKEREMYFGLYNLEKYEGGSYRVEPNYVEYVVKSIVKNDVITGYMIKDADASDSEYVALGETLTIPVTLTERRYDGEGEPQTIEMNLTLTVRYSCGEEEGGYFGSEPYVEIYNEEYHLRSKIGFYADYIPYTNTVAGILAGTPSTFAPDYEG